MLADIASGNYDTADLFFLVAAIVAVVLVALHLATAITGRALVVEPLQKALLSAAVALVALGWLVL